MSTFFDEPNEGSSLDYYANSSDLDLAPPTLPDPEPQPAGDTEPNATTAPGGVDLAAGWSLTDLDKPSLLDDQAPEANSESAPTDLTAPVAAAPAAPAVDPMQVLQEYGGVEGAVETLGLINGLITGEEQGVTGFLQSLYDAAQPAYVSLVDQIIQNNPEYALEKLREAGLVPAQMQAEVEPTIGSIEPDVWETIPEELRDTAMKLPAEMKEELNLMSEAVRNQHLSEKRELQQMRAFQQQQMEAAQQAQYQQAVATGVEQRDALLGQIEKAHLDVLGKWQPYGPEASTENQALYESLMEGAMRKVLSDPQFATMYRDFNQLMTEAPLKAMAGNKLAAEADTRRARGLAAQFNTQYARELQGRVKSLDTVFRGYRSFQNGQAATPPERKEIRGSVISDGKKVSAIGPDGQATDEFLRNLAAKLQ